eukprot:COSAG01_NODE_56520_length_317_cov_57.871560_1_plen_44_part_10
MGHRGFERGCSHCEDSGASVDCRLPHPLQHRRVGGGRRGALLLA